MRSNIGGGGAETLLAPEEMEAEKGHTSSGRAEDSPGRVWPEAVASDRGYGGDDPADAVEMVYEVGLESAGPIERFLSEGKKLPVLLLTCNRDGLLRKTIQVRCAA